MEEIRELEEKEMEFKKDDPVVLAFANYLKVLMGKENGVNTDEAERRNDEKG